MHDRLAREIAKIWALRRQVRMLSPVQLERFAASLTDTHLGDWLFAARDNQLPPLEWSDIWMLNAGRGFGKTRVGAETCHLAVMAGLRLLHIVCPTAADVRDVAVEGPSGLIATAPDHMRPTWEPSKRRVEWPNGATAITFSGDEPESLRGPQAEFAWIDELARMRYQQMVYDMASLGLRVGERPRMLITTTPRPTQFFKRLYRSKRVIATGGSTFDNAANLAPNFLEKVTDDYADTTLGSQELYGLIVDVESDLFKLEWIGRDLPVLSEMVEIAVGVDPSGGADEIGIVVAGRTEKNRGAVLADRTLRGSPEQWGRAVVKAYDDFQADSVVAEMNFGGDMVMSVVQNAALHMFNRQERETPAIRIKPVTASRGKVMRAEPISLLYEQGRIDHAKNLQKLEAEMSSFTRDWDRARDGSPNRLDALVWAFTKTMASGKKTLAVA